MRNLLLCFVGAMIATIICGCSTDYWKMQDKLARDLNKRYGDTNFCQIVPMPLADYPIGTILYKGLSASTKCVFAESSLETNSADRIPPITRTSGFNLKVQSPTNITRLTAGIAVAYGKPVYISYTHMTLQQVKPDIYRSIISDKSECKETLQKLNTSILVGYLKAQFKLSSSATFDVGLGATAFGANGTLAYTNSDGWTVLETNSVPCFALVATPNTGPHYEVAAESTKLEKRVASDFENFGKVSDKIRELSLPLFTNVVNSFYEAQNKGEQLPTNAVLVAKYNTEVQRPLTKFVDKKFRFQPGFKLRLNSWIHPAEQDPDPRMQVQEAITELKSRWIERVATGQTNKTDVLTEGVGIIDHKLSEAETSFQQWTTTNSVSSFLSR
jgi:hypothetical protein